MRGRLVTIEGVDGVGKTTLAHALYDVLRERGCDVLALREPGGVPVAEAIRRLVKDPALALGARAEALLYAAARAQLVDEALLPALAAGQLVLLDRFVDSSLAYQGAGRWLGIERVRALNAVATDGLTADRTLLLELEPQTARQRARGRQPKLGAADRLEREDDRFFARIAGAYRQLAAAEPARFRVLDAGQSPPAVLAAALAAIEDLL